MSNIRQETRRRPESVTGSARVEPVISVRGLVKRYGSHEAVAGIDLEVRHGEIFAFLGSNGRWPHGDDRRQRLCPKPLTHGGVGRKPSE